MHAMESKIRKIQYIGIYFLSVFRQHNNVSYYSFDRHQFVICINMFYICAILLVNKYTML